MKKLFIIVGIMLIVAMAGLALAACSGGDIESVGSDNGIKKAESGSSSSEFSEDQRESEDRDFIVTFDANGGALRSDRTITVKKGDRISNPADPAYSEHVFLGWSKSVTKEDLWNFAYDTVSEDMTLYACWENEIVVSFNANGGHFSDEEKVKNVKVNKGSKISMPDDPSRDNYTFTNWYADSNLSAKWDFDNDSVVASITLYAGWAYDEQDVTFVLNYSGAKDVVKKTVDGKIDYTPERDGYVFNGWWLSSGRTSDGYILSKKYDTKTIVAQSGLTLYAEWVEEATMASQLTAPSVGIENGVFSWEAIPGAQSYGIIITKSGSSTELERETVNWTSWSFPDYSYEAGYYNIKIRANGDGIKAVNSVYVTKSYANKILPSVTDISLDISTSVLTWSALSYHADYYIYLNNQLEKTTSDTVFDMSGYDAGSYNLKIEAQYSDYTKSVSTKTITKYRLKAPVFTLTLDNNDGSYLINWGRVLNANQYIVKINDIETKTNNRSFSIPFDSSFYDDNDEFSVSVSALDSNADYLISVNNLIKQGRKPFSIEIQKSIEEAGTVEGKFYAFKDEEITLIAETNPGYIWLGWYDGETKISHDMSNEYSFEMSVDSKTYIAKWEQCLHVGANCVCTKCGFENHTPAMMEKGICRHGEYVFFGTYPQSEVTDKGIASVLTGEAGILPTAVNSAGWTSYGYYINGSVSNYMWYIDLEYSGEKYRGVYFTKYRPNYTGSSTGSSNQDDNGYTTESVYWFKYEPIKWRILSEKNGEALILCEMIIDSQEYYSSTNSRTINGQTVYANNYAESNIRAWLNDTFYNTAFTDLQKQLVVMTTVNNSAMSTNPNNNATAFDKGTNTYACADTEDYIFLLSEQEVTNSVYGFDSSYSNNDTVRTKKNTDYAKSQGVYSYADKGPWWLRSPNWYGNYARHIGSDGGADKYYNVWLSSYGVVPALRIRL